MSAVPKKFQSGFTLIELGISVTIFIFMTALLIAKFGNFNQSVLLTNLAYDIALTMRTAQTFGLSVQGKEDSGGSLSFDYPYGIAFCALSSGCKKNSGDAQPAFNNRQIILYADTSSPADRGAFDENDIIISTYNIKRGAKIVGFCDEFILSNTQKCVGTPAINGDIARVDISYIRPNPMAYICRNNDTTDGLGNQCYAQTRVAYYWNPFRIKSIMPSRDIRIVVEGTDGNFRTIYVNKEGQISVGD